jgi:hypothetical protein
MKKLVYITTLASFPSWAFADSTSDKLCQGANLGNGQACPGGHASGADAALTNKIGDIVNLLLYITGALAVIVLIYGGIRYVTSTGDAKRVQQAKDTIVYAITGLVIAILAYAIVNFVVGSLS